MYPINNNSHFNPYAYVHPSAMQQVPRTHHMRPVLPPGAGIGTLNGQPVNMTPLSRTGFFSAFSTRMTQTITARGQTPIPGTYARQILTDRRRLAQKATADLDAIAMLDLGSHQSTHQVMAQSSMSHIRRFSHADIDTICEALDDYQGAHGDNYLMNISAMGYPTLDHFLHSMGIKDENSINDFLMDFLHNYGEASDDPEELEETRTRLADRLAEPTDLLTKFIHSSPRLDGIPLLKGSIGTDMPFSTQINGKNAILSALAGNSMKFNGFLSTTATFHVALEFSGIDDRASFGRPMFTVDLTSNTQEAEIIRRAAIGAVQQNQCSHDAVIYYAKASRVAGISVNATKLSAYPNVSADRLASEDEILLNPDHFFNPEQVVLHENGVAMIGTLKYGRD